MKEKQDYIRDIAEIRSMMERSSKFLSLSGWAGIMAGVYALAGSYIAYKAYGFNPGQILYSSVQSEALFSDLSGVILTAIAVLILAIGTAVVFSIKKAKKKNESVWNAASRRLLAAMAVPLLAGGILIIIFISQGLIGLVAPLTLLFYGLSLFNASKFTYEDVRILGVIQIGLGLVSSYFVELGLIFWALGFGFVHIIYGIYIHFRYER